MSSALEQEPEFAFGSRVPKRVSELGLPTSSHRVRHCATAKLAANSQRWSRTALDRVPLCRV